MSLDFITRSFYWLPRIGGGLAGTYEPVPAGGIYYISETSPLPAGYKNLPFPAWLPRQVFISSVWAGYGLSRGLTPPEGVELTIVVDPGGTAFKTGHPPGAETGSDFTRDISLLQYWSESNFYQQFVSKGFDHPVLLNRDAGDKLLVDISTNPILDWFYMELQFIVPSGNQPSFTGTGY